MTTYKITQPSVVAALLVSGDLVVQAGPALSWAVGRQWESTRDYIKARGWTIEPVVEDEPERLQWLEYRGTGYEFRWDRDTITRITAHSPEGDSHDIGWAELPDVLRRLL